ncbi:dihydrofolate reductase family protein [Nocardioides sp. LS1]|uniref:dihydrofolate reductase family protein n=1 Tax=Nocardioides sp. LS1 TaxID=1027620 RepID=UPI000F61C2ED|nr:dihydrofolate reductase family protein [Nocardioides sp. LS1]GCD90382.1 dihydrofolate reductase [Nocardioides sp. LS1]
MRRIVAYMLVSIDGVAQDPDEFVLEWDEEMDANLAEVIGTQDTVLLGRGMHDEWSRYWPSSDIQPFADFINAVEKYVATSSPLTGDWPHARAIEGDVLEFVRGLAAGDGGDVGVHGSMELTASLLAAGLVDDLRLVVAPRVAGKGRRLFGDGVPTAYELVASSATPTGALLVHYRRVS